MTRKEAQTYYDWTQQALSGRDALLLREFLKLDKKERKKAKDGEAEEAKEEEGPHCNWPVTQRVRFQQTWWDWDWALGNLLVNHIKYSDDAYASDKKDLDEVLHFVKGSSKTTVKCVELFGNDELHTLTEFGAAIEANPAVRERVAAFLGVRHYKGFREVKLGTLKEVKKRKKGE
jgi:hypothetical protein